MPLFCLYKQINSIKEYLQQTTMGRKLIFPRLPVAIFTCYMGLGNQLLPEGKLLGLVLPNILPFPLTSGREAQEQASRKKKTSILQTSYNLP